MFLEADYSVNSLALDLFLAWEKDGLLVSGYSCMIVKVWQS